MNTIKSKNDFDSPVSDPVGRFAAGRRAWFESRLRENLGALEICRQYSKIIDDLIKGLCMNLKAPVAVMALGGLGRKELGLGSDIDLLFLHDGASIENLCALTNAVLYPFWNCGIEAGGATRTIADCRNVIASDVRALTAMTEARLIFGDESLALALKNLLMEHFAAQKSSQAYIEIKIKERRGRLKRYGDAIYFLEPNVKEGEGGLRDYHTLLWTSFAAGRMEKRFKLSAELESAVEFMWRVRHILHMIEGKRADRLTFQLQEGASAAMGYAGDNISTAAEKLMSSYCRQADIIRTHCERGLEKMKEIALPPWFLFLKHKFAIKPVGSLFSGNPLDALSLFARAKRENRPIDAGTRELIIEKKYATSDGARSNPEAGKLWREIFSEPRGLGAALSQMQECGILFSWFPEMETMFYRVQHDGSHFYTAGVHSILAVREIERMLCKKDKDAPKTVKMAVKSVLQARVLLIAAFFHDIGKARGGGHSEKGADLAADIMKRLGISDEEIADATFLIKSHLLMSALAFKRDVHDPSFVEKFAETIRSPEVLAMLYLLTIADIKSVGPGVMTGWKAGLLSDLYRGTLTAILSPGDFLGKQKVSIAGKLKDVKKYLGRGLALAELGAFVRALPERYVIATEAETIAAHFLLSREIASHPVATASRPVPQKNCTEFSVVTRDKPGLFARVAGILAAGGANITGAEAYTNTEGLAIDVFWVTSSAGGMLDDPDLWKNILSELSDVIVRGKDIDEIVSSRFKKRFLSRGQPFRPVKVVIDNDVSAVDTVVEVSAPDRRGLLYAISSTLYRQGCTIERARITTLVDRVIDVFYVRGECGSKITAREEVDKIKKGLMEAIGE